jgi:uncharacterized membrane protein (UPF0127 family)
VKAALVTIGRQTFRAEVADNIVARTRGLSGHAPLAADEAMLFVFPLAWRHAFWMKGMLFSLDMIWVHKGRIVDISADVPAPAPGDSIFDLAKVRPRAAADMVLEVNAGLAARGGWRVGDQVRVELK